MKHQQTPLVSPVPGTVRYIDSFHFGPIGEGKKAYIQASLHADELPGMLVAWKLKQQLVQLEAQGQLRGEVVLVPVANPLGLNQQLMDVPLGRYELETGQNFNRDYYDPFESIKAAIHDQLTDDPEANLLLVRKVMGEAIANWSVQTELHSQQKALQSLSFDADLLLDLHCDFEAALHLYSTDYSWPGIEPLARLMGCEFNLLANETGGNPFDCTVDMVWQRLHAEFGDKIPQGCLGATVELRGQADVTDGYADQDSQAILHYLQTIGFIDADFGELPEQPAQSSDLAAVETLKTSQGGVLVLKVQPGDYLEAGALFAEVINPITDEVEQVRTSQPGRVYSRSSRRMATAGMLVGNVAGDTVIRSGFLLAP